MSADSSEQAERLYAVFAELVRAYLFRDREERCCYGLSVSQCYTLETLATHGPATMSELADSMRLDVSTMTRVVDHLVGAKLATRVGDPRDRRVCLVRISRKGESLVATIRAELVKEHEAVLRAVAPASRESVIRAMSLLLSAFRDRPQRRCKELEGVRTDDSKPHAARVARAGRRRRPSGVPGERFHGCERQ